MGLGFEFLNVGVEVRVGLSTLSLDGVLRGDTRRGGVDSDTDEAGDGVRSRLLCGFAGD